VLIILFYGPPSSGKGTQAKILASKLNLIALSTGDIMRSEIKSKSLIGLQIEEVINSGKLVSDEITFELVKKYLLDSLDSKCQGIIFDGFPRNIEQASLFENLLKTYNLKIFSVICFSVPDDILFQRVANRSLLGRADDSLDVFSERLKIYRDLTSPLERYYNSQGLVRKIDGSLSLENVTNQILTSLNL
jgi:adenylate kinase